MSEILEEVEQVLSAAEWAYLNYSETNTERKDALARVERVRLWVEQFRWIPCTERMPEPHTAVLVWNGKDVGIGWNNPDVPESDCTHWMTLPEGPEE